MNPQSKAKTWRLPLSTLVVNSDPISPISKPIEVIEKSAYDKAVEALKIAQKEIQRLNMDAPLELTVKTGRINLELIETLRELGVE